jgi:hypothetical protein
LKAGVLTVCAISTKSDDDIFLFVAVLGTLMLFASIIISIFGIGMSKMFNDLNAKMNKKMAKISLAFREATGVAGGESSKAIAAANDQEGSEERNAIRMEEASAGGDNKAADGKEEGKGDIDDVMTPDAKRKLIWSILSVTFFAVVREGLECVVFLAGMTASYPAQSVPLAAFAGIVTGAVIGYLFYRSGSFMNMKYFAIISMTLLFMVAAGLVARSFHEWVELGAEGGPYVWDAEWCCSTSTPFWGFLQMIFGYNDHPTVLEFMIYWTYWAVLLFACWRLKVFDSFKALEKTNDNEKMMIGFSGNDVELNTADDSKESADAVKSAGGK